ncbi:hypothetical protein ACFL2H_00245 [Planctomycetota bacterium]
MQIPTERLPAFLLFFVTGIVALQAPCHAQPSIEDAPIAYSKTVDQNRVTDLIKALKDGDISLEYDRDHGYLKSVLSALDISVSSQVLVFSKTSMQITYISPRTPRAVYFNDDTYVGWVQGSSLMEISTNDPKLGAAFYTVRMSPSKPRIQQRFYSCLACHASTMTQGVPGHTVRSVLTNPDGTMDVQRKSFVTDHASPLAERWGGWYVTGHHGEMQHMGNAILRGGELVATVEPNHPNLKHEFYTEDWLTPHSDIVALMALEHQTQMHNTFTVADFTVRRAFYDHEQVYGKEAESKEDAELALMIERAAEKVVDYMLFVNEATLTSPVKSSTTFATDFTAIGPADPSGRSLRDFDLHTRLFKFPCSYLIYSPAFDSLTPQLRDAVYRQLWKTLAENRDSDKYAHLPAKTRRAIVEILRSTKDGLPGYWKASPRDGTKNVE